MPHRFEFHRYIYKLLLKNKYQSNLTGIGENLNIWLTVKKNFIRENRLIG